MALHLMESPLLNTPITKYEVKGEHLVDKVSYDEKTQRVSINKAQYFEGCRRKSGISTSAGIRSVKSG